MTYIKTVYKAMSIPSRIIIVTGIGLVLLVIAASILILLLAETFFADFTTAYYWYEQCILLGKEILGATLVPVMLFEIIMKFVFVRR
ncbi:MAG: hypothetical protein IJE93_07890 [Clostridia bacterium]|mgnify:CR=1 FL=1|nr:hypothetical protein [Clostridia bacterium]